MGQKDRPNYWKNAALLTGSDVVLRLAGLGLRIGLANALADVHLDWSAARSSLRLRDAFYRRLAASRPSMKVFLTGWRNRVKALHQHLADLEREAQ